MAVTVETQQGLAKIFGLNVATMTVLTGVATITISSADLEHNFKLVEDPDQEGNVETLIAYNEVYDVTIDFIPNGATRAAAITSLANTLPGMITKVVLANFDFAVFNGNFNYIGGWSPKITREGLVICGIKLRKYIANNAALVAGVISG